MNKVLLALFLSLITYKFTSVIFGLAPNHALLLAVLVWLIALWTNEGLPLGVVSLFPLVLFPLLNLSEIKSVAQNYSHPIIFLFLGGFLLAIAFEKTHLHQVVANKMLRIFPSTTRGKIYAVMITSALLSSVLSNTTITLMLLPIVLSLAPPTKVSRTMTTRFLLATAYGASIGGVLTPIGTPPNLILLGFLEQNRVATFSFSGWIIMLLPVVVVMLLIIPYFLSIGLDDKKSGTLVLSGSSGEDILGKPEPLNKPQRKLVVILCLLIGILFLNSRYGDFYFGLGINETILLLGFGLILFLPGINLLEWKDASKIPWEIIFLFGAGFSIANTIIESGLPSEIMSNIQGVGSLPLWTLIFIVALGASLCTEVTSNTAFIAVALPIFSEFSQVAGVDPRLILPVATVATSYAFMLPIATPPNAIVMSSRVLSVKTMAQFGFVVNMIGAVVLTMVAYYLW